MRKNSKLKGFLAMLLAITLLFQQSSITTILAGNEAAQAESTEDKQTEKSEETNDAEDEELSSTPTASPTATPTVKATTTPGAKATTTPKATAKATTTPKASAKTSNKKSSREDDVVTDEKEENVKATTKTDLALFLQNITISGTEVGADGTIVAVPGKEYTMVASFAEGETYQFANDAELTYTIPKGVSLPAVSSTFDIVVDGTHTVQGNTYEVEGTTLKVTFNKNDPNFNALTAAGNAQFKLELKASFDGTENKIEFSSQVEKTFEYDTSSSLDISKKSELKDGKVYYTVTVTSHGSNTDVVIQDTLTGKALKYSKDVAVSGVQVPSENITNGDNGFTVTISKMTDGQQAVLTYTATVDMTKFTDKKTTSIATLTGNTVTVHSTENPDDKTASNDLSNVIKYTIGKEAENVPESGDTRTIDWKITVNSEKILPMAGVKVTDAIAESSVSIMKYSGQGITITRSDGESWNVSWDALGLTKDSEGNITDTSWTYTFPDSETEAYQYEITYQTTVDASGIMKDTNVNNSVSTDDKKEQDGSATVKPGPGMELKVTKTAENVTYEKISWKVVASVPITGTDSYVVTDTLPNKWANEQKCIDSLDVSSLKVTGLLEGESYTLDTSNPEKFTLTFYQNEAKTIPGLKGSDEKREIVITFDTINNTTWLEAAASGGDLLDHQNNVAVNANDTTVTASATGRPVKTNISKSCEKSGTITIDDVTYPVYKYVLTLEGVNTETTKIQDTFDTDILKLYQATTDYDEYRLQLYGGNQYDQRYSTGAEISASATDTGLEIKVSSFPKNGSDFYSHYKIIYSLIVKDEAALETLKQNAADNGGTYKLKNKAVWNNNSSGDVDVTYSYEALTKSLTEGFQMSNNYTGAYTITVNPDAKDLIPDSDTITVTDTPVNLRILPETVKFEPELPDATYNIASDGTATFVIPDETKVVITCKARVVGTGYVQVSNSVTISNAHYSDSASEKVTVDTSGSGTADNPAITLHKYVYGNMNSKIQGARYQLYRMVDGVLQPVTDKSGENVSFTTDADGNFIVKGDQENKGWVLWKDNAYALVETEAPEGYVLDSTPVYFTIKDEPTLENEYFNGQTIYAANEKEIFHIVKVDSADNTKKLAGAVFTVSDSENQVVGTATTDENGIAAFSMLEPGNYIVTETSAPEGYQASDNTYRISISDDFKVTSEDVTIETNGTLYWFEVGNAVKSGDLTLTKTFAGDITPASENVPSDLSFTVAGPINYSMTIKYSDFTDGSYTLENLPLGDYTVTESSATVDGYTLVTTYKVNGVTTTTASTTLTEAGASVELINTYTEIKGGLTITKTFAGDSVTVPDNLSFTVTGPNDYNETIKYSEFTKGSYTINDLPLGIYTVTEINAAVDGYKLTTTYTVGNTSTQTFMQNVRAFFNNLLKTADSQDVNVTKDGGAVQVGNTYEQYKTDVNFKKTDVAGKELVGAELKVTKETADGDVVESWTSDGTTHVVENLTDGTYVLTETKAPDGYKIAESITFEIKNGKVVNHADATVSMVDNYLTDVTVSKVDLTTKAELSGAELKVTKGTADGEVVASWTSDGKAHVLSGLEDGTYVLTETSTPDGYKVAESITFVIENGKVKNSESNSVVMEDEQYKTNVNFKKTDVAGKELAGAELKVTKDTADGTVVESWKSDGKTHVVENLTDGTYVLTETTAPNGYKVAESITFVIKDGKVTGHEDATIIMIDEQYKTTVNFKKTDVAGKELAGAELKVTKDTADGTVVESWKSDGKTHVVENLTDGTYVLTETKAPDGYKIAESITFEIKNGKVVNHADATVTMVDNYLTDVTVSKVDLTTKAELSGAELKVTKGTADGEVVASWTSDGKAHVLSGLEDGAYVLTETSAPDGYKVAESITFVIENGKVKDSESNSVVMEDEQYKTNVNFKKTDVAGKELAGAELKVTKDTVNGKEVAKWVSDETTHVVENLTDGTYVLTETSAPEGYKIAQSITFEIKDGVVVGHEDSTITMTDEQYKTTVKFKKTDVAGNELPGAVLKVTKGSANGEEVASWTSDGTTHIVENLTDGTYVLTETTAPGGYKVAESISFVIKDGKVVAYEDATITMVDYYATDVTVSKVDLTTKAELSGAELKVTKDTADGDVVESWISDGSSHVLRGLEDGTYVLTEVSAPNGYKVAESVTFIIENGKVKDSTNNSVVMEDEQYKTDVNFKKTDVAGKELVGAELKVTKETADGEIVDSWTSEKSPHVVKGMTDGIYVLTEISAPDGYKKAESITFEIKEGKVVEHENDTITMVDNYLTDVTVSKLALTTQTELAGAKLKVTKGTETGDVVAEWTSNGTAHVLENLEDGTYVLTEVSAPYGYTIAESITFVIENGKVTGSENNTVVMEDAYELGDLELVKTFEGDEVTAPEDLSFTVTGPYGYDRTISYSDFTNGRYVIEGIPAGIYTVVENNADIDGYTVTTEYTVNSEIPTSLFERVKAFFSDLLAENEAENNQTVNLTQYGATVNITNTYEKLVGDLTLRKTFAGAGVTAPETLSFTVTGPNNYSVTIPYSSFVEGAYTFENLPIGDYTVTENDTAVAGYILTTTYKVNGSDAEAGNVALDKTGASVELVNTYTQIKDASITLEAMKTVDNGVPAEGETFDFVLEDAEGNVLQTVQNDADGKVAFEALTYTYADEGTYTYTVKESGSKEGYIYDKTAYTVTVTVAPKADDAGQMEATATYTSGNDSVDAMTFNNRRTATGGEGSIAVTKMTTYSNRPIAVNATYYVALFSDAARTTRVTDVKTLTLNGEYSTTVTFDGLPYGTYYVSETLEDGEAFSGSNAMEVEITNGECVLSEVSPTATAVINNKLGSRDFDYGNGSLVVTKNVLRNGKSVKLVEEDFYVGLFVDEACTVLVSDVMALEIRHASSTTVTFTDLTPGTYYVAETDESGTPVDNDSDEFDFIAEVVDGEVVIADGDTQNATINNNAKSKYPGPYDDEDETPTPTPTATPTATVTTTVTPRVTTTVRATTTPTTTTTTTATTTKTGDETPLGMLIILLLLSGSVLVVMGRRKRREE